MDSNCTVLEISSDEEEEEEGEGRIEDSNYEWITKFLDEFGTEKDDDTDDVVVVGEVINNTKKKLQFSREKDDDDDDDECMVLDGDPDKMVSVVDDKNVDSDELVVVGEKGQIACRDYPHPRHLCVQFPFSSTPHKSHCDRCHCFVCDSLAPCVHWGNGISNVDHCHATDKVEIWKIHRTNFKLRRCSSLPPSKFPDSAIPLAPTQPLNQAPSLSRANTISDTQVTRPSAIRASSPRNFGVPNIISQGRSQSSGVVSARLRFQPHLVSHQLLGACNNNARRGRGHLVGNIGPRSKMFKRAGTVESALPNNCSGYGTPNNVNHGNTSHPSRNFSTITTSMDRNHIRWEGSQSVMNSESAVAIPLTNPVSSPPLMHSQLNPLPNDTATTSIGRNHGRWQDSQSLRNLEPNVLNPLTSSVSSPPLTHGQPIPLSGSIQNMHQHGDQSHRVFSAGVCDFGTTQVDKQSNQQTQVEITHFQNTNPPEEPSNNQFQDTESVKEPSFVSDFTSQTPASVNPKSLYFDFEDWLLDNPSVPGVPEASVPSGQNILSPQPAQIDADMLYFDFETSWNGLHMHS